MRCASASRRRWGSTRRRAAAGWVARGSGPLSPARPLAAPCWPSWCWLAFMAATSSARDPSLRKTWQSSSRSRPSSKPPRCRTWSATSSRARRRPRRQAVRRPSSSRPCSTRAGRTPSSPKDWKPCRRAARGATTRSAGSIALRASPRLRRLSSSPAGVPKTQSVRWLFPCRAPSRSRKVRSAPRPSVPWPRCSSKSTARTRARKRPVATGAPPTSPSPRR